MDRQLPNESDAYRQARNDLMQAEESLRAQMEEVASLRRALPPGGVVPTDYEFRRSDGTPALLSSLFEAHDTLLVYSLMYGPEAKQPCPMCAALLDALNGQTRHLASRAGFAVVAQSSHDRLAELKDRMGWTGLTLLSASDTTYQRDYLAETDEAAQLPMMNVFRKGDDGIRHFWASELFFGHSPWHPRHLDTIWPLWNLLDFTPEGRGNFIPKLMSA